MQTKLIAYSMRILPGIQNGDVILRDAQSRAIPGKIVPLSTIPCAVIEAIDDYDYGLDYKSVLRQSKGLARSSVSVDPHAEALDSLSGGHSAYYVVVGVQDNDLVLDTIYGYAAFKKMTP